MLSSQQLAKQVEDAASNLLAAVDGLRKLLTAVSSDPGFDARSHHELVPVLHRLVESELVTAHAFELLLKIAPAAAVDILVRRYLGEHVDPDTRYGGFQSNLSLMLSDMASILGNEAVKGLVNDKRIPTMRLQDPRVRAAFGESLELEEADIDDLLGV